MDVNQIKEDYVIRNLCREAKIMSKLNHPCIVALFQTMQRSDNVYYLVTELVSGGDLCTFVKSQQEGRLEERPTRMYGRQFASALSHMHGQGIVHRDLKMENVMLNPSRQQIKIVDFGLSNVWSASSPLRTHCGSPEYAAPELFVTGKQYGAEVDLWSLGIILYGMVLGQLPFVTSRSGQVTSQERRKKLVAQINRGLASVHRRALSTFSSEFRSLMNRLLVADAAKRITVKELVVHPWITEKGKKMIRSNPLKTLEPVRRNKIIMEIGTLLQLDSNAVNSCISQDPLGKIGGMFNILQRRYQMSQLTGDGVTRVLPSLTLLELADLTKNIGKEKKIYTARSSTYKNSPSMMPNRNIDFCTPRMIRLEKTLKPVMSSPNEQIAKNKLQQQMKSKKDPSSQKTRPNTVQTTSNQQKNRPALDYRVIKSPSLRRKAYSATITPKSNRTFSPGGKGC
ncbi:MAP/microtubule affinity-regulating kinase 4 [Leptinotarsa decemlineata]|uniref:MAP/microtubule affinity-regulating kinase 4 n=1 Tax=Leptinotarsa decemlineata TaxID=7539 RepID=UPI003D30CC3A